MDANFPFRRFARMIGPIALTVTCGALIAPLMAADFPGSRSGNCPNCPVNSRYFGYYPTLWRRWPGTEPQPQAAPTQPPETTTIPPVEPPPPAEEIENKNKPMGAEPSGGGTNGTSNPMSQPSANSGAATRMEVPADKRPVGSPPARDALLSPLDTPEKLNRLPSPLSPPFNGSSDARRNPPLPFGSASPSWPPANMLRHEELRANVEFPDRSSRSDPRTSPPIPFPAAPRPEAVTADLRMSQPFDRAANPVADWQAQSIAPAAKPGETLVAKHQPDVGPAFDAPIATRRPLHWLDPPAGKSDQSPPNDAAHKDRADHSDDSALNRPTDHQTDATLRSPQVAAAARLPFVPNNPLCTSLPPIDPQAPAIRGDSRSGVPAEAADIRLAPPNRVTDISVPTFANSPAKGRMAPPDTLSHSNVTKIDPLAIGRSLDTSVPPAAPRQPAAGRQVGESYQLTEVVSPPSAPADQPPVGARFSAHAETPNTVKSVAADFSDSRKQIAMPPVATPSGSPSSAPSTTAPFAAPDHMVNPMTQTPLPAIAPANGHFAQPAGIVVSDDPRTARDRVQQATYLGAAPLQRPAGQPNPLRDATRTGGEAMSTDSPAGWSNPLR